MGRVQDGPQFGLDGLSERLGGAPRWYRVYFFLAAFDLCTVSTSLYLNQRIVTSLEQSVAVNQAWVDRLRGFGRLGRLAADVDAPGNNVFETGDIEGEAARMDAALARFDGTMDRVRADLSTQPDGPDAAVLRAGLDAVDGEMRAMVGHGEQIFGALRRQEEEVAGGQMAAMDRSYSRVVGALDGLAEQVRAIQNRLLQSQLATARSLRRYQIFIAGLALLMVVGLTTYGNLLMRKMQADEERRRRYEREILQAKEAAEEASRARSAFLATMSHELRTPLTVILGFSDLLEEELRDTGRPEALDDLGRIRAAANHQLTLVNNILDLSKIDAGRMDVAAEPFDICQAIDHVVATVAPLAEKRENRLEVDCPADLGTLVGDVVKLRQVLFNLLSNAAKFTDGGRIRLRVARDDAPRGACIRFEVADDGIGMSAAETERLFQAFVQGDARGIRARDGTGLGLAISLGLAKLMGGDLTVESAEGRGSTFVLTLPATAGEASCAAP